MRVFILIILMVSFVSAGPAVASEFHVAMTGDDKNPGTEDKPFRSINQAREAVGHLVEKGLMENIYVYLHRGTYRLQEPLIFNCQDGGTEKYSITYQSYEDDQVIVSGGKVVHGWQMEPDGRWIADPLDAGVIRELFVNGRRAQRARHPNSGYLRTVKAGEDRMSYFTFNEGEISENVKADLTELVFIHDWSISRIPLAKIDFSTNRIYPRSKLGRQHPMMVIDGYESNPRYFLENDPSFCDIPGEWCQQSDGGLIYFPRKDESIEKVELVIPFARQLLVVRGDEASDCMIQNLHFKGITFENCRFDLPEKGYAGVQATFHMVDEDPGFEKGWRGFVPPAISFELARDCSFKNGTIRHMGGAGLMFGSRTYQCTVANSELYDISGNGIMIGESWNRLVGEEPWWKAAPEQTATGHQIRNCLIEECGIQYAGAVGIWVGLARNTMISQNQIRHLPYTGISIGWMWNPQPTPCMGNIVENNHIHHIMQVLSDGGGIYTLGYQPGTILRGNLIHDVPLNAGRAESNGMFLDEGTTDIEIIQNAIFNTARSPLRFHKARINTVRENIFGMPADMPPVRYNRTDEKYIHLIDNKVIFTQGNDDKILENAIQPWRDKSGRQKQ